MAHIDSNGVLQDPWSVEDVHSVAERKGVRITDEEAAAILVVVADNFDANDGINWDVIEHHFDALVHNGNVTPEKLDA